MATFQITPIFASNISVHDNKFYLQITIALLLYCELELFLQNTDSK